MYSLLEATTEGHTTGNLLELGEIINSLKLGVVLDSETTTNLLKQGERDVGELLHVNERECLLNDGQVGGAEELERGVRVELQALGDLLEEGDGEVLGTGDLDLSSQLKLVHDDFHSIVAVVEDLQLGGDVDKVRSESVHLSVVVDLEALDGGDAKTAQIADEGIGNSNALDLSDTFGTEVQLSETRKLDEAEARQALERGELEVAESLEVFELEVAIDGLN